jgi:hypothetical protein
VRSDLEFQRVYEFLSRLHKEFEPRHAQLLARGRVPISEVLSKLRAKETHLLDAGLLEVSSVLATRGPPSSTAPRSTAPPLLPTPQGPTSQGLGQSRGSCPHIHCSYYDTDGHTESHCFLKERDLRQQKGSASSGARASSGSSPATFSEQDIVRLKRLLAASGSSSPDTAGSVTNSSGTARPPSSTQSGTSSWVLDSKASFSYDF